jgi:hypothetical protein
VLGGTKTYKLSKCWSQTWYFVQQQASSLGKGKKIEQLCQ